MVLQAKRPRLRCSSLSFRTMRHVGGRQMSLITVLVLAYLHCHSNIQMALSMS